MHHGLTTRKLYKICVFFWDILSRAAQVYFWWTCVSSTDTLMSLSWSVLTISLVLLVLLIPAIGDELLCEQWFAGAEVWQRTVINRFIQYVCYILIGLAQVASDKLQAVQPGDLCFNPTIEIMHPVRGSINTFDTCAVERLARQRIWCVGYRGKVCRGDSCQGQKIPIF